ncbi:aspartate--tRNA ligase, partial [Candidatus Parcubacteria bacterium]
MNRILTSQTVNKIGETVVVAGWIHARRDMGKVKFFDIRDKDGLLQVVVAPGDIEPDFESVADELRPEWVVQFEGIVQKRGPRQVNDKLITGTVEL